MFKIASGHDQSDPATDCSSMRRCCEAPGCVAEGSYPAPKSRDKLNEYLWFCLDHVRIYNRAWDYCAGLSSQQIEELIRGDTLWQRPTWPLGDWRKQEALIRERLRRDYGEGADPAHPEHEAVFEARRRPESPEEKAMRVLDLVPPVTFDQIKSRYRELVKTHHPDTNGGDRSSEERLKTINQAYTTLKAAHGA